MPRKKKTDDTTISCEEKAQKKEKIATYSPYGSEALREKAMLKKPALLDNM